MEYKESELVRKLSQERYRALASLERADKENALKDKLTKLEHERRTILKEILETKRKMENIQVTALALASDFRQQRIEFLEREIERNLAFLQPLENFRVKINFTIKGENEYAELLIGKEGYDLLPPRSQNGRFLRQLISFTVMYTVNKLRDCKFLFCDEALASADAQSLSDLKPLMEELLADNFQIVLIEHKEELYNNIDRKEIHLYKDREQDFVKIVKEEVIESGN